jgi:mannosyltransferase OCH1-like enzyme
MILDSIEKVDFFKYVLMYEYGGIYIDMDIISIKPLSKIIYTTNEYDIVLSEENRFLFNKISISNSVLFSKKSNNFWINVLNYINEWDMDYITAIDYNINVLVKTGPIMLNNVYNKYKDKYKILILPDIYLMTNNLHSYIYHLSDKTWSDIRFTIIKLIIIILFIINIIYLFIVIHKNK